MSAASTDSTHSPAGRKILRVAGICKRFGSSEVLREVSFGLREQEILGVIGPSGGGKTTLLKCLDLLETIEKGRIEYHGPHNLVVTANGVTGLREAQATGSPPNEETINALRQDIGLVFQSFNLWDERTVLGNLTLAPIVVRGVGRLESETRAVDLCRQFGLADKVYSKVWQLSGGQRQRVAIIRALMMQPKLMLLDEITSALDPVLTVEVMQAVRKLREQGLTMIVVTHHIEFASSLCDRIMFLAHGEVVQIDTPENLRNAPVNDEVRKFLEILRAAR
ncbi:MAG: amino acid ABC transporter ATP-binding protein [Verrucomicrobiae bacterium]|nr:amino acid ABC transporter ATP-binding protein [Verrucomicrobiae bacterium]